MADITFSISSYTASGKQANGTLSWSAKGLSSAAVSGPFGKGFLPLGDYGAKRSELLDKDDPAYQDADGLGWMQVLRPKFTTPRTDLGIHPDGNVTGTEGCIGLSIPKTKPWFDAFKANTGELKVTVENASAVAATEARPSQCLNVLVTGSEENEHAPHADTLGIWLAEEGYNLLVGGGQGVLVAVARGFCSVANRRGRVVGVLSAGKPVATGKRGSRATAAVVSPYIDIPVLTQLDCGHELVDTSSGLTSRSRYLVNSAGLVIAVGGDETTRSEVGLAVSQAKGIVLYGPKKPWHTTFTKARQCFFAESPQELRDLLR